METVFLIHGWGVNKTTTYGALHLKLAQAGFKLEEIFLGRYVTRDNQVEIRDIAKAMQAELVSKLGDTSWTGPFHFITHSTGALVAKLWLSEYYRGKYARNKPLRNILFLAGAHFGSRLAHHARSVAAQAVYGQSGRQVLTALELGSRHAWEVNETWAKAHCYVDKGVRSFNLIGDKARQDLLRHTMFREPGSDEVIRSAAGNLNFRRFELDMASGELKLDTPVLQIAGVAFGRLKQYHHTNSPPLGRFGIMEVITRAANAGDITAATPLSADIAALRRQGLSKLAQDRYLSLKLVLVCLKVKSDADYKAVSELCDWLSSYEKLTRFSQVVFRFSDHQGYPIDDYYVEFGQIQGSSPGERVAAVRAPKRLAGKLDQPTKAIAHIHKNLVDPQFLTVFIDWSKVNPNRVYYLKFHIENEDLFKYESSLDQDRRREISGKSADWLFPPNRTTQFDVRFERKPEPDLFVFEDGTVKYHKQWDRFGKVTKDGIGIR